ncbi:MAG TPA: GNAT family N-acetyltransferase [Prolixibacteraceae bacterium]|nr:GNAT family N-acetyltransferase [Prolixibacteraceae bacterium]
MNRTKLEYGQVRFRALEPEDIDLLYEWENDASIWEVSNTFEPFSKYVLTKYIRDSQRDIYEAKEVRMIIETPEGTAVGAIDLFDFDPFHLRAGVGILIQDEKDRNQGYATDALHLLCNYAANNLRLHQLYANITEDNLASIQLFTNNGFQLCGTKKDWRNTLDGWKAELMFQKMLYS